MIVAGLSRVSSVAVAVLMAPVGATRSTGPLIVPAAAAPARASGKLNAVAM